MRKKMIAQQKTFDQSIYQLAYLVQHDTLLKRIDNVIDSNPQIVELVHSD